MPRKIARTVCRPSSSWSVVTMVGTHVTPVGADTSGVALFKRSLIRSKINCSNARLVISVNCSLTAGVNRDARNSPTKSLTNSSEGLTSQPASQTVLDRPYVFQFGGGSENFF